jgi:TonB-linked SusC/RagA family outer membrane protein
MFKKRLTMQISTNVRRIALFFLSMVLSTGFIFAQERTITGKVTAEGEGPLPGVNITVQGTVIGAISDLNGGYSIKVPGPTSVLMFSSIGYVTKQVTVGTQNVVDVVLVSDVTALSEVVVTGYTAQRRRDLTGSVGVVEPAKLTAVPTGNVSNSLQGRTSGVTVTGDGRPGESATVRIRGFGSFQNNDPLYVVDGVPTQDISSLNPNDIESISVLKDAGAASIYGSRASNGVIIVTTKKGSKGTKVSYSMYYGTQLPGNGPTNLLNTQEYANLQWLVYKNDGTSETHPVYGPSSAASPSLPDWAANTNWYKAITRNAPIMNHDVSLSGGTDNAKFFAAVGALSQNGIVIYTDYKKYTARFNSEFSFLKDRIKVGENINMKYSTQLGTGNLDESSPIQQAAYRSQPIIPVRMTTDVPGGLTRIRCW